MVSDASTERFAFRHQDLLAVLLHRYTRARVVVGNGRSVAIKTFQRVIHLIARLVGLLFLLRAGGSSGIFRFAPSGRGKRSSFLRRLISVPEASQRFPGKRTGRIFAGFNHHHFVGTREHCQYKDVGRDLEY